MFVMGVRGPVPKRSEDRQRRNEPVIPVRRAPGAQRVRVPGASREWCKTARQLWKALKASGQSAFYEPSDWAYAYFLMDEMTRYVESDRQNGQVLASILSGLSELLVAEGNRRRVGVELARPDSGDDEVLGTVTAMREWVARMESEES